MSLRGARERGPPAKNVRISKLPAAQFGAYARSAGKPFAAGRMAMPGAREIR
jgi:hypothetical protein